MSTVAAPKAPKAKAPKKEATHPAYAVMVKKAVADLKERNGSSRAAILKFITANFKIEENATKINARLRSALIKGLENGELKQAKGTGAAGSFRLAEKPAAPKKAPAAKKPASAEKKKAKVTKKTAEKKTKASPKKSVEKKTKKAASKPKAEKKTKSSPKKAAAKPKAPKAKKAAAKA